MERIRKIISGGKDWRYYNHLYIHTNEKYLKAIGDLRKAKRRLRDIETQFIPGHFYSPYPDIKEIDIRKKDIFDRSKKPIAGIDIREKEQLRLLSRLSKHYRKLPYKKNQSSNLRYTFENPAYSYTDAVVLFCMLNELTPKKIIEIGSGYSSALMIDVNELFFEDKMDLTFIEPYPELLLSLDKNGYILKEKLVDRPLWKVDEALFDTLNAGDILFIDSTHVSKVGSDVNQIFFSILPALKKGVIIHIHDVFYPFEYPIEWVKETRAWNEDYLLRAFLYNNKDYEILFFNHFMNTHHKDTLKKSMPLTIKNPGGSLWLKKVG